MKWIVQKNLPNRTFEGILSCLDNTGRDVTTVSFTMDDIDSNLFDVLPSLKPYFGEDSIYFNGSKSPPPLGIFGSVAFIEFVSKRISLRYCPTISSVADEFDFMKSTFGDDYLNINADYAATNHLQLYFKNISKVFVKPLGKKTFPGVILKQEDFHDDDKQWIIDAIKDEHTVLLNSDIKTLAREMRFWVIDGQIITHSTYALDGMVEPIREVPQKAIDYAEEMIKKCPLFAYTLDIAEVIEDDQTSLKVIEINCINTSGTYDADESAIIDKLEQIGSLHNKEVFLVGDRNDIVDFKDCNDEDFEEWAIRSPFCENYLKWFEEVSYEPMVLLLEEQVSWYKLPLHKVTNELVSRSEPDADAISIDDSDVKLLYKLSWE